MSEWLICPSLEMKHINKPESEIAGYKLSDSRRTLEIVDKKRKENPNEEQADMFPLKFVLIRTDLQQKKHPLI